MNEFEDNGVEKKQNQFLLEEASQWVQIWANFLLQPPFSFSQNNSYSLKMIEEILAASEQGNSCIEKKEIQIHELSDLFLNEKEIKKSQVAPFIYNEKYLYLYRYWQLEQSLAEQIIRVMNNKIQPIDDIYRLNLLQDEHQKQALEQVAKNGLTIITGGPGTGKTYTLARIIAVLQKAMPNIRVAMAAPTGKAAQRMKDALQNSFTDENLQQKLSIQEIEKLKQLTPITLHRLLGLGQYSTQAKYNKNQPLPYDVVVVDEASMLDLSLANMLFSAVDEQTRLILLGDAQQLASVNVGNVLADLQATSILDHNKIQLVTSRRFKEGALIGKLAKFIQQPDLKNEPQTLVQFQEQVTQVTNLRKIKLAEEMSDVVQIEYLQKDQIKREKYYNILMDGFLDYVEILKVYLQSEEIENYLKQIVKIFDHYRILTAVKHGEFGLFTLNMQIEKRLLAELNLVKSGDWYIGRPVMMTYNDYQLGLSNGDIGICLKRNFNENSPFEVYFPSLEKWVIATRLPKNVETAYALTIHKSQGSEFTHTAVVLDSAAENLLSKELIYTAVTRAKSVVSLLVDAQTFLQALTVKTTRKSGLVSKINQMNIK